MSPASHEKNSRNIKTIDARPPVKPQTNPRKKTMNLDTPNSDFLDQFRNISTKLKKRFLRKPNVTEASAAFAALGLHCEQAELPAYAGLCWIAAARCEGSLSSAPTEVTCLLRAARLFVKNELKDQVIGCPGPASEHLQAALNCYTYAGSRCPDNSCLSRGINLEIAHNLRNNFQLRENSIQYVKTAISQSKNCLETRIHSHGMLASTYIETGDYTSALITFTEMAALLENSQNTGGAKSDCLLRCEISRIFLLLILRPTAQRLAPGLAKLLEKYTWNSYADVTTKVFGMSETMFVLLQSLVMACQSQDTACLPDIEQDLWPLINPELRALLRVLIKQYYY